MTEELVEALRHPPAASPPISTSSSSTNTVSPRLAFPEKFDGSPTKCKGFLLQCSLFVNQQPMLYSSDDSWIAFVCSLLTGKALEWATAGWNNGRLSFSYFSNFLQRFREVFEHPEGGKDAGNQLLGLRQGKLTAVEFALSFRTLAAQTVWVEDTLKVLFHKGLNLELQSELARFFRPSTSPASARFFFIYKKNGGLCPCINYRSLNYITVKFRYPLPLVPAALEQLRTAKYFTKLDLRSAYNLIRIPEGDEWKTAFSTSTRHYEYLVMLFGLVNSPSVFQAFINDVFRDMLNRWAIVYIDDILIYSDSLEEHVRYVRSVLQCLIDHQLYAKAEKCEFHRTSVSFLGYEISPEGIDMNDSKVQAVMK